MIFAQRGMLRFFIRPKLHASCIKYARRNPADTLGRCGIAIAIEAFDEMLRSIRVESH